jgi:lipopolysaccharide export system permease protein
MIIERYILKNYFGPFIFSMSVITFVFIMDFVIRYIDLFLSKGVPFLVVMQTFALSLGHMFALIIPMAVLPATLMTFGNFAGENEITAMRATGLSMYRMILPGSFAALVLSIGLVFYNNMVLPESNHMLMNLLIDINKKQPTVELQENRFIDDLKGYTIYFQEKDDRTGEINDVQIFKHNKQGLPTSIVAERGRLSFMDAEGILKVELYRGEIHELPGNKRDRRAYRKTLFESYTLHIRDVDRRSPSSRPISSSPTSRSTRRPPSASSRPSACSTATTAGGATVLPTRPARRHRLRRAAGAARWRRGWPGGPATIRRRSRATSLSPARKSKPS